MFVDEFPEVSDSFARPDHHQALAHAPLPLCEDSTRAPRRAHLSLAPSGETEPRRALGGRLSSEPSLERPLAHRTRTPPEALVVPRPEPVRREARIRKLSRRHVPSPALPEEEVVVKPPAPPEPGSELAQLQGLLTLCSDLSKETARPDVEWARELIQQMRDEFDQQLREQRKVLQHLTAGIKELMEQIARRETPEEPAAKRARPASVEISSDGGEGSEARPTALLVAEASGALGILVGALRHTIARLRGVLGARPPNGSTAISCG